MNVIWEFKPHKKVLEALKFLDLNIDGLVTVAEFALLVKHEPMVLQPIRRIQKRFKKNVVFTRFWREQSQRRFEQFQYQTIFDILQVYDPSFVVCSMEYLLLQPDVPNHLLEQYRFVTLKKKLRRKGDIEMPYELRQGKNGFGSKESADDGSVAESKVVERPAWVGVRRKKPADLMNADSFVSMT